MRAAVYRGIDDVRLEDVPVPEIGPGELLLRVHACGVCGTDLKKIRHGLQPPPRVFGHEIAGTVAAVSAGDSEWRVGDRLVAHHHVPCGACFYCERRLYSCCEGYRRTGTTAGFEPAGGGFAEFIRVMPFVRRGLVRIPEGVPFEQATLLEPLNTVLKGIAGLKPQAGEHALVVGEGPIGLLFTRVLADRGLTVIGSDPLPYRRQAAGRMGALAIDPGAVDVAGVCRDATGGRGADLAVVTAAGPTAIPAAVAAVRPGGRVLLFGQTRRGELAEVDVGELCVQEKALLGSYSADIDLQPLAAELLFGGRIPAERLITHRFPLEEIGAALAAASEPRPGALKVVVTP